MANQKYNYCFKEDLEHDSAFESRANQCNPMARAKVDSKGRCKCTPPYQGKLCEECAKGFHAITEELDMEFSHDEKHVICVSEQESDEFMCNGFGTFDGIKQECKCEKGYAG